MGEVTSIGKCEDLRRVYVYQAQKGDDLKIGKDITDEHARYSVVKTKATGSFYVRVPASVSIGYSTEVDCERIKSKLITIARTAEPKR